MVCWQVGALDAARGYVAEAMPLLAGSRRIARVVLLCAAAGIALADGDLGAAVELGTQADSDAGELGIDREIPLIRCLLAQAMLAGGNVTGAAAKAAEAMTAARALSFKFPIALGLETAALVVQRAPVRPEADIEASGRLLAAATAIRERGNRPCPVPLSPAIAQARVVAPPPPGPALDPAEAVQEAAALLTALAE
jgi:ATP/maltotriose-dependent transcriptional regulator MalT